MGKEFPSAHARFRTRRRSGSTYIAVLGVAVVLTLIGIASVTLVRIDRRSATLNLENTQAQILAQSAVELSITKLSGDSAWRSEYVHDSWQPPTALGNGSLQWKLVAASGDLLSPSNGAVQIVGRGTVGNALADYGVDIENVASEVGPQELRSYTNTSGTNEDTITSDHWLAQYVKPTLPAGTSGWKVTSVELRLKKNGTSKTLYVRLYTPDGYNMPQTVVESKSVDGDALPSEMDWVSINYAENSGLDPNTGLCLALETSDNDAAKTEYKTSVAESESALITGTPTWTTYAADDVLPYKIHGTYEAVSGAKIVKGTWTME